MYQSFHRAVLQFYGCRCTEEEILEYFANIPTTSPARYNHPYQYLHALFAWCAKQDYLPYNPFDKLELKKLKDEGNIKPATIEDIQSFATFWLQNGGDLFTLQKQMGLRT